MALAQRVSRLLDIIDQESRVHREQTEGWLTIVRAASVPGNLQLLDDMLGHLDRPPTGR